MTTGVIKTTLSKYFLCQSLPITDKTYNSTEQPIEWPINDSGSLVNVNSSSTCFARDSAQSSMKLKTPPPPVTTCGLEALSVHELFYQLAKHRDHDRFSWFDRSNAIQTSIRLNLHTVLLPGDEDFSAALQVPFDLLQFQRIAKQLGLSCYGLQGCPG